MIVAAQQGGGGGGGGDFASDISYTVNSVLGSLGGLGLAAVVNFT